MESLIPKPHRLLVVDDEPSIRQMLQIALKREGYEVVSVAGFRAAAEALATSPQAFPVVLTDLSMPDGSGFDVLAAAKRRDPSSEVILITAHSTVENAITAMRGGAYDFVTKPFQPSELAALVQKALEKHDLTRENTRLRARVERADSGVLGRSPAMRAVMELVDRIAATKTTVLITGESGTGKERVARAIHERSDRRSRPFLVVNCGALPEALMESELFGHEKGAFTGAQTRHNGLFREADGGTLLLDEVGELPASLQVKLLRVLQERSVRAVGATQETAVDVRVLAATNRDIEAEVARGGFRQDLYYRLNVIRVVLPPLRDRREDIPLMAERFLRRFAAEMGKDVGGFTADALRALERYAYPGNVRELENVVERSVALAGARSIGLGDLPAEVAGAASNPTSQLLTLPPEGANLDELLNEVERRLLVSALDRTGGNRTAAAKLLGVTFRSLRYRLSKHGLGGDDEPPSDGDSGPQ
ncbi:MAG: sigma-54-dependent Fis family transcriptional regulator [Polyangiaceae bacterium]|nr:sigma-54-dependent Fis family transcriptional regulator [Polyangiaceae bacterium]MCL4751273.1 sigma-54 dependent transcriptional regulator [Myxococcales bacterium]